MIAAGVSIGASTGNAGGVSPWRVGTTPAESRPDLDRLPHQH